MSYPERMTKVTPQDESPDTCEDFWDFDMLTEGEYWSNIPAVREAPRQSEINPATPQLGSVSLSAIVQF